MSCNKRKADESDEESVAAESVVTSPVKSMKPKHPLGLSGVHRYVIYTYEGQLRKYIDPLCHGVFFEVGCEKPGGLADYYREEKNMRHIGSGELRPSRVRPVYVRQDTSEEVPCEFLKKAMYDGPYKSFIVKSDKAPLIYKDKESHERRSVHREGTRLETDPGPDDIVLTYEMNADNFGVNRKGLFLVGLRKCTREEEGVCLNKVGKKIYCMAPLSYLTLPGLDVPEEARISSTMFNLLLKQMKTKNLIATFMWMFRKGGVLKRIEARVNKDSTGLVVHEVAFRENIVDLGNLDFPVQPKPCEECSLGSKRRHVSRAELQQEWLRSQKPEGDTSSSSVSCMHVRGRNLVFQCKKCCRTFHDQDFYDKSRRDMREGKVVHEEHKIYGMSPDPELVGNFERLIAKKAVKDESVGRLFSNPEILLKNGFRQCMIFGESPEISLEGIPGDFLRHVVPLDKNLARALTRSGMVDRRTAAEEREVEECLRGISRLVLRRKKEKKGDKAFFDEDGEFDEDDFVL